MNPRDPRSDPAPGDVVRNSAWFNPLRYVEAANAHYVYYTIRRGARKRHGCAMRGSSGSWERFGVGAVVIYQAEVVEVGE